jgi:hypothetical protein
MILASTIQTFITQQLSFEVLCLPWNYPTLENFEAFQYGYRYDSVKKENLVSQKEGEWQEAWFVIASNYFADPFFINMSETSLGFPVYFASCGAGKWQPVQVSESITEFSNLLATLKLLSRVEALEYLKGTADLQNKFWQEVVEAYSSLEEQDDKDSTEVDNSKWILGKVFITDLGKDKLKIISYLKTQLQLTPTEALTLSKQLPIEIASGYLLHLEQKMKFLENLGATVNFVEDK